eukprot:Gb_11639 [translate_table: standard]
MGQQQLRRSGFRILWVCVLAAGVAKGLKVEGTEARCLQFSENFSCGAIFAVTIMALCCAYAVWASGLSKGLFFSEKKSVSRRLKNACTCSCSCGSNSFPSNLVNGSAGERYERIPQHQHQPGASMMEQLVPEITTHALSYLDYPSLCRLSMTNSLMRRAANDDNAWKTLYHKDFTAEQDTVSPPNGWKSYYAATKAVVDVNEEYYNVLRTKNIGDMSRLWLKADYVKCVHAGGEILTGYDAVMESWDLTFNWNQRHEFQLRDVRVRVLGDMAWVTLKEYVDAALEPFLVTNIYEFHNGQWFMVHHHSSSILEAGPADPGMFG